MMLANLFGLKYALSAGIITVLSVQNTKRKSIEAALSRLCFYDLLSTFNKLYFIRYHRV